MLFFARHTARLTDKPNISPPNLGNETSFNEQMIGSDPISCFCFCYDSPRNAHSGRIVNEHLNCQTKDNVHIFLSNDYN